MASFRYKAVAADGSVTTGLVDATSDADAVAQIRRLGHLPLVASRAGSDGWRKLLPARAARKPSAALLAFVTQELAALLSARLPLDRALAILIELDETAVLRAPFAAALSAVRGGASLADALDATGVFPKSYVTVVRAGEHGAKLEVTLKRLADYLARASAVREAVLSAATYPIILLCTAVLSVVFVMTFVLPQFAPLFEQSGKALPWPTVVAMATGAFLRSYWWLLVVLGAVGFLALRRLAQQPHFQRARDRWLLRLPVIGELVLKTQTERFSRMLGTLLQNAVALPQALLIARDTLTNTVVADAVSEVVARLKEGDALSARLRQSGVFPPLAVDMIRVGEETGTLDDMLLKQADLFEHDVRHNVERLLALAVPAMTIAMGLIVAGLIASVLVAILSINDLAT